MGGWFTLLITSLQQLANQMIVWVPKVILALIIWWIGKYFVNLATRLVDKFDLGINVLPKIVRGVGKFVLLLIVLDYLGIGRTVVGAVANGLTLAVAIALGIAFGRALEDEAKRVVSLIKKRLEK